MIRLAFIGVFALAGLIAFGAFFLARGSQQDVPQIAAADPGDPSPVAPVVPFTPEVDRLYYLRDIDFDAGDITVMLFETGTGRPLIIRDQAALRAAADSAYVNTSITTGQAAGSFALMLFGAPPTETVVQVFRNDTLVASVSCTSTSCGSFAETPDINHAGLADHAISYQVIDDTFDDHQTYLDTILAISEDPHFMLLDKRPRASFPSERRTSTLMLSLPTVVNEVGQPFDPIAHETLVSNAIASHLPPEASVDGVAVRNLGQAVVADRDNNQPVTAGGVPIGFPHATFYGVQARVSGLTALPAETLDQITTATTRVFDVEDVFAGFVTDRLQNTCVDCFFLKVDGPFHQTARVTHWQAESYYLTYYDLREGP